MPGAFDICFAFDIRLGREEAGEDGLIVQKTDGKFDRGQGKWSLLFGGICCKIILYPYT